MPRSPRSLRRALAAALVCAAPAAAPAAEPSAVVFVYHRFGEDAHPSTNTRLDQLAAHVEELAGGGYTVLPLAEIAAAVRSGRALPDRTVGISIDDAYRSVHDAAWPRFRAAGLPFTLFVATDPIDRGFASYMSWDQLRALAADPLVDVGSQTASHPHMPLLPPARNRAEIEKSNARFAAELGLRPALFAYPYGEASLAVRRIVAGSGFAAAFGQHSGAVHRRGDAFYMPRFALNEAYGGMERFRLAANALPLEAMRIVPADPFLAGAANPPEVAFTVGGAARARLDALACYASGQGRAALAHEGRGRVRLRLARPFPPGRARINCTMPAEGGRWRWFGRQFLIPEPDR